MFDAAGLAAAAPVRCTLCESRAAALRDRISAELSLRPIAVLNSAVWRFSALRRAIFARLSLRPVAGFESAVWRSALLLSLILNRFAAGSSTLLPLVAPRLWLALVFALRAFPPPLLLFIITLGNFLG